MEPATDKGKSADLAEKGDSSQSAPVAGMKKKRPRRFRRLRLWAGAVLLALLAGLGLSVLNNNVSVFGPSRQDMSARIDRALEAGTRWTVATGALEGSRNCALVYMAQDMARLSGDKELAAAIDRCLAKSMGAPERQLLDPNGVPAPVSDREFRARQDYQRWLLYAAAPTTYVLSGQDRADMFSPDKHHWGSLTHQLIAVVVYRQFNGKSAELDRLVDTLCERIAREEFWDFRVTDLYIQRVAALLGAGRADLVKRRWVERVISNQEQEGGWTASWYGLGPGLLEVRLRSRTPGAHTTVQGLWALYMLKYRFPQWTVNNYGQ